MTKIGRNTPCPCGSGRKYKACCLASASASDFQFRLNHRLSGELIPQLIEFASENPQAVKAAWIDFHGKEDFVEIESDERMNQLFMPWFLFNWDIELPETEWSEFGEVTLAELFLVAYAGKLSADERDFIVSSVRCPYTFCEVLHVKPGVGFTLFDLFRRIQYEVVERTASQAVRNGELIYCATSELRGFRSNIGTGPYPLRPTSKLYVLELREWIVKEAETERITTEHLLEFEDDIRWLYLDLVAQSVAPPVLVNYDGHPMLPQKLYFDIVSANETFHALKSLAKRENEENLLEDAVIENGSVKKVEFPWLGDAKKKGLGGLVVFGTIAIDGQKLVINVNSTERADTIRKIVDEKLGGRASYRRTMIEPVDSQIREMWQGASVAGGSSSPQIPSHAQAGGFPTLDESEVRSMLAETVRQYWDSWFDEPVPVLNNMTPREAAKTEQGRDLLESLLLEYENRASAVDEIFSADIPLLRRKLGMG